MRIIDADELKKVLCEEYEAREHYIGEKMLQAIDNAPTVEAYTIEDVRDLIGLLEKRPQGQWYYNCQNGWHCSICHEIVKDMPTVMGKANFDFCPHCGADMRGKEE